MIAEGGLEDEVENWDAWKRIKRRVNERGNHVIPVTFESVTVVAIALIKLKERIKR